MFAPKDNTANSKSSNSLFGGNENDFLQPKLNVGKSGDKYEVEADKAADQIVSKSKQPSSSFVPSGPSIQKQTEEDVQKQEAEEIQQKPVVDKITPGVQLKPLTSIQKQPEEEVQAKEDEIQEKEEEEIVQQKTSEGGNASGIENQLSASKGGGSPLDSDTRGEMESGFGSDFSGVRVHNDSNAVQMNQELGSQAFTNGNDIYFNEGKYDPSSDSGKHLLAHELTHTVQQGASPAVQTKLIQKTNNNNQTTTGQPAQPAQPEFPQSTSKYDMTTETPKIIISSLPVPPVKYDAARMPSHQLFKANNFNRTNDNDPAQVIKWKGENPTATIKSKLESYGLEANKTYAIRHYNKVKSLRVGDSNILAKRLLIPYWKDTGAYESYDVDHFVELQTAGWPKKGWGNTLDNFWLLSSDANQASGRKLDASIKKTVSEQVKQDDDSKKALKSKNIDVDALGSNHNVYNALKSRFDLYFTTLSSDSGQAVGAYHGWPKDKILAGDHVDTLMQGRANNKAGREAKEIKVYDMTDAQPQASKPFNDHDDKVNATTMGSSSNIKIFRDSFGAEPFNLPWNVEGNDIDVSGGGSTYVTLSRGIKGIIKPTSVSFNRESLDPVAGHIMVDVKQFGGAVKIEVNKGIRWTIHRLPGQQYAGYLELTDLMQGINDKQPHVNVFSPANVQNIGFDPSKGIVVGGGIASNLPIFNNLNLQYTMEDDDFKIYKVFSPGEFKLPSPFEISDVTLIMSVGTRSGIGIEGKVNFGIKNVGEGFIGASASTGGGFELEGEFNFDSKLFDPAKIGVKYKDNIWTIEGEVGIPQGKVRGVKRANIKASYSQNVFKADGEAELDIPGIEKGSMNVEYGPDGFSMGGRFELKKDIPGIKGGRVEAKVSKKEGEEDYNVFVSGTAQPDVPGINSSLTVTYDNGALTIEGKASYSRGMLSGEVTVGATNRAIGDDGKPSGEIDDTMRVYGGGSLTLQLTPWLKATAGVKFLPNGEMEVTARLDAPRYDVFPRKEINKNLFTVPTIEIPLFAIPLGPKSIGLVAQIGGGLDFKAGFGPGHIRNVSAEIKYNPDKEEETTVTGHGEFAIPADAGLTLRGDVSVGASVVIASITGGIELAGTLGLAGEALASVDLGWSPQTGLEINAMGSILVSPKFKFDINAFIRGTLGIGWFSVSETWRKNLLSYEWGSGIEFGIKFPVNYKEGEPFSMSFDDVEVVYPELDIPQTAKSIASDVKDQIF